MSFVYYQNRKTQEIHRVDEDGRSLEECNLDDARDQKSLVIVDESVALHLVAGKKELACGHCWPKSEDS